MPSLDQIMDLHVRAVRAVTATVEPNGDVTPILGAWRNGLMVATALVEIPKDRSLRTAAHEAAMRYLVERHADAYTFAMAAWVTKNALTPEELRQHMASGMGVADRADRTEMVLCIAGDRDQTIYRGFEVIRSQSGRIASLKLFPFEGGDHTGLFCDLLRVVPRGARQ